MNTQHYAYSFGNLPPANWYHFKLWSIHVFFYGCRACDNCEEWFHGRCIKINPEKASTIKRYYCGDCTRKNPELKIKYKKSKGKEKRKHDKKDEPPAKKAVIIIKVAISFVMHTACSGYMHRHILWLILVRQLVNTLDHMLTLWNLSQDIQGFTACLEVV